MTLRRVLLFAMALAFWILGEECSAAPVAKKLSAKKTASAKVTKAKSGKKAPVSQNSETSEVAPAPPKETKRTVVNKGSTLDVEPSVEVGDVKHYKYKLNGALGIDIVSGLGSAFHIGGQLGFAVWDGVPFYVGPDVGFSLFSPGNTISTAVSAWYELRIYGAPRLSMSLGAGIGPVITSNIQQYNSLTYQGFLDGCIVQEINDIASVRGQLRPSMVGGYFGLNMNLNVQFRFQ